MSDKQIEDWQAKVRESFGDEAKLYEYLFHTMDNFYYRYMETSQDQNLKTTSLGPEEWGARSRESSMVEALKLTNPVAKKGIIELAKSVPKAQGPQVLYQLMSKVKELTPDRGEIHITAEINWGFPDYKNEEQKFIKKVIFKYNDLDEFRKELALKLEEACSIFL